MAAGFQASITQSAKITWRAWSRVFRQLFYEVLGAVFGLFAVWGSLIAWRQYHSKPAAWLVGAAIAYAVLMTFFCITSFARARRTR
jgi:hypothetical protein